LVVERLDRAAGQENLDRTKFLQLLGRRYYRYLDDPLQRAVRATLGVEETPAALHLAEATVEPLGGGRGGGRGGSGEAGGEALTITLVRPGETLHEEYTKAHGQLLLLGAPGAGKSTQLHELGRELVRRAQNDPMASLPMPVIVDLSTWAVNHDPLDQWL